VRVAGDSAAWFANAPAKFRGKFTGSGHYNESRLPGLIAEYAGRVDIWMFEGNPVLVKPLQQLTEHLRTMGFHPHLYAPAAAWVTDGPVTFHLDTVNDWADFWTSSVVGNADTVRSNKSVTVPGYSIAKLIQQHYRPEDYVIVKCDIEGAEWVLVRSLIQTCLPWIDEISVEWHDNMRPKDCPDEHAFKWMLQSSEYDIRVGDWH
jgi:FkbM family methyltransferase